MLNVENSQVGNHAYFVTYTFEAVLIFCNFSEQRLGRLWEFIRDLLLSEKYCPKYICWDNYEEGKFRFVESDKVAKLWGSIKGNASMNYEKFSRAMR